MLLPYQSLAPAHLDKSSNLAPALRKHALLPASNTCKVEEKKLEKTMRSPVRDLSTAAGTQSGALNQRFYQS